MATLPGVSSAAIPLDELFDEEISILGRPGNYDNPGREDAEALEEELKVWRKERAELDGKIEAAERLLDEFFYGKQIADRLAQERAENRARME